MTLSKTVSWDVGILHCFTSGGRFSPVSNKWYDLTYNYMLHNASCIKKFTMFGKLAYWGKGLEQASSWYAHLLYAGCVLHREGFKKYECLPVVCGTVWNSTTPASITPLCNEDIGSLEYVHMQAKPLECIFQHPLSNFGGEEN